jgi:hypothetical protein
MAFANWARAAALIGVALSAVTPADAYLYWSKPAVPGPPATGDDPTVVLPLKGATAKELQANLIWTMRAGLNVAALQCQFAPSLRTVANYNNMLRQHGVELASTYTTLGGYFKRTLPKTWANALDQHTTRTYNSFSTLNAQLSFCEVAGDIGRETLEKRSGQLAAIAASRLREFRNSLKPVGDASFGMRDIRVAVASPTDLVDPFCYDTKNRLIDCTTRKRIK